jgi:hypothetical protein
VPLDWNGRIQRINPNWGVLVRLKEDLCELEGDSQQAQEDEKTHHMLI